MTSSFTPEAPALAPSGSLRRSVQLFQAIRSDMGDSDTVSRLIAQDSVREMQRWGTVKGNKVVGIGGSPAHFGAAFRHAGAAYLGVDPGCGETAVDPAKAAGPSGFATVRAAGTALPFGTGSVDICCSNNVLERVPQPELMADEMLRITRPGGLVVLSWTPWLSPWSSHDTAPWNSLGGLLTGVRHSERRGAQPKDDFGRAVHPCSVSRMIRWMKVAEASKRLGVVQVLPRYHPRWARWVVSVPGVREIASWDAVIVVRRR